jgi:hypothetical protein
MIYEVIKKKKKKPTDAAYLNLGECSMSLLLLLKSTKKAVGPRVAGQPELHSKILFQKNKQKVLKRHQPKARSSLLFFFTNEMFFSISHLPFKAKLQLFLQMVSSPKTLSSNRLSSFLNFYTLN